MKVFEALLGEGLFAGIDHARAKTPSRDFEVHTALLRDTVKVSETLCTRPIDTPSYLVIISIISTGQYSWRSLSVRPVRYLTCICAVDQRRVIVLLGSVVLFHRPVTPPPPHTHRTTRIHRTTRTHSHAHAIPRNPATPTSARSVVHLQALTPPPYYLREVLCTFKMSHLHHII
jgi:hypothetical protein